MKRENPTSKVIITKVIENYHCWVAAIAPATHLRDS
jgi:hypothetical protein